MIVSALLVAGMIGMTGCGNEQKGNAKVPAIDPANMDLSVKPGTDFYLYSNGGWMQKNQLKPEYSRYGIFDMLTNNNLEQLHAIVDEVRSAEQPAGSSAQKIATLYNLGMDSVTLNAQGAAPIREYLESIEAIKDNKEMTEMFARMHKQGFAPYFVTFVDADEKNSSMNIATLYQAGLGMGDRDYYLANDEDTKAIREAYKKYIHDLFVLAGYDEATAEKAVASVMKIENKIAKASYSREALRDSHNNYTKMTAEAWKKADKSFDWDTYFAAMNIPMSDEIVIKQTGFFNQLAKDMADVTLDDQKLYAQFNLISNAAPYLSDDFVNTNFEFNGRVMSGREQLQPRWKRALSTTEGAMGEALGQLYVEKYFPASSKEKMLELVRNLQGALSERIAQLEWMSDETKARAQEKLANFYVKIGYPDEWRDYSALEIKGDESYWANILRSNEFEMNDMLSKAGTPVDKNKWHMNPQMVNAYYNPTTNEICFPAGILQPPFFNPDADDAVNYGAIGVVIGHEMTHGFDDQGRNYDKDGNMNDWWTKEDAAKFNERAQVLVDQFNAVEVADGVYANGAFTLGENIADQGGLLVARLAYENSLKDKERPAPIDGLTDAQRFYIAYASVWAQNIRPEEILRLTKIDPHSLGVNRVNVTLRNIDDFYEAFDIVEGDPMYLAPEKRVNVW